MWGRSYHRRRTVSRTGREEGREERLVRGGSILRCERRRQRTRRIRGCYAPQSRQGPMPQPWPPRALVHGGKHLQQTHFSCQQSLRTRVSCAMMEVQSYSDGPACMGTHFPLRELPPWTQCPPPAVLCQDRDPRSEPAREKGCRNTISGTGTGRRPSGLALSAWRKSVLWLGRSGGTRRVWPDLGIGETPKGQLSYSHPWRRPASARAWMLS